MKKDKKSFAELTKEEQEKRRPWTVWKSWHRWTLGILGVLLVIIIGLAIAGSFLDVPESSYQTATKARTIYTTAVPDDFDSTNRAHTLGLLIGYEKACGLSYYKGAMAALLILTASELEVDVDTFSDKAKAYSYPVRGRIPYMKKSLLWQACDLVRPTAKEMGLID